MTDQEEFGVGEGNDKSKPTHTNPDELAVKFPSVSWYFNNQTEGNFVEKYLEKQDSVEESSPSDMFQDEWDMIGTNSHGLNSGKRKKLQDLCYSLYHKNPIAGNIIDNYNFYTLGKKGVEVIWEEDAKEARSRWSKIRDRNQWSSLSKDISLMTFITGEDFLSLWPQDSDLKMDLRQIHPTNVTLNSKDGDPKTVENYIIDDESSTNWSKKDIQHFKVRDVGPVLRGRPILERVIEALTWYHSYLKDRVHLMRTRSRLPIIRYVEGKPEGVPVKDLPEPGTVIDENRENEWKFPELNLSSSDVKKDARELKLYIATGVSLPEYMCTMDASNSNYSSTVVTEGTPIHRFKDLQGKFRAYFRDLIKKLMPKLSSEHNFKISFPEVDLRNFKTKVDAVVKEYTNGLRSKRSSQLALDLDPDLQQEEMEKELGSIDSQEDFRKVVESIMFHAPAIKENGTSDKTAIDKLVRAFEKRGWLNDD